MDKSHLRKDENYHGQSIDGDTVASGEPSVVCSCQGWDAISQIPHSFGYIADVRLCLAPILCLNLPPTIPSGRIPLLLGEQVYSTVQSLCCVDC